MPIIMYDVDMLKCNCIACLRVTTIPDTVIWTFSSRSLSISLPRTALLTHIQSAFHRYAMPLLSKHLYVQN